MSFKKKETLFIFFDESGNFDFSPSGTPFWSLGALCTYHPAEGREAFLALAYSLADEGTAHECFHATEDKQATRDRVFDLIMRVPESFDIHFSIAEKRKVPPALRKDEVSFYSYMCRRVIRHLVTLEQYSSAKKFVVVFSSIFNKNKHDRLLGELKSVLKEFLNVPFWIYFKASKNDINCQLVDYCCWAISIKWTRGELRSYNLIQNRIVTEEPLFSSEGPNYY